MRLKISDMIWLPSHKVHKAVTFYGVILVILMFAASFVMDWRTKIETELEHRLTHQHNSMRELLFYKMRETQLAEQRSGVLCNFTSAAQYNLHVQVSKSEGDQSLCASMLAKDSELDIAPADHRAIRRAFFTSVDDALQRLSFGNHLRITIVLAGGEVIGDSDEIASDMGSHNGSNRPELFAALKQGVSGKHIRKSETTGDHFLYMAEPLLSDHEGNVRVALRASRRMDFIPNIIYALSNPVLYGIAYILLFIFGGFFRRIGGSFREKAEETAGAET